MGKPAKPEVDPKLVRYVDIKRHWRKLRPVWDVNVQTPVLFCNYLALGIAPSEAWINASKGGRFLAPG